jgi:hypothetical protein
MDTRKTLALLRWMEVAQSDIAAHRRQLSARSHAWAVVLEAQLVAARHWLGIAQAARVARHASAG